jgi:hypothetical protein
METLVASVVRQESWTWSPAETTAGVAEICAVGAGAATEAGAVSAGGSGCFFLQPAMETKATRRTTGTRMRLRRFNGLLLPQIQEYFPSDPAFCILASSHHSGPCGRTPGERTKGMKRRIRTQRLWSSIPSENVVVKANTSS